VAVINNEELRKMAPVVNPQESLIPPEGSAPAETETGVDKITKKEIADATATMKKYKEGKESLEKRIVENEQWYKMRHWEFVRNKYNSGKNASERIEPASGWMFNSIFNKHADAMDNYPEPNVLPRERNDEQEANTLSAILPVIFERNKFKRVYSDAWWYKLKHGTAVYGIFWDNGFENGLGDISVKQIDLLNIFWEPGVRDIQDSQNLFIVALKDNDAIKSEYPDVKDLKTGVKTIDVAEYKFDDTIDTTDKSVVVDWYYKRKVGGRTILHRVQYVGETILYASENDPDYAERGWYDHGKYPVVFDVLFPEEGTPFGFGYVDLCKDSQTYIDKLNQIIAENVARTSRARYLYKENSGVNKEQFRDLSNDLVDATGTLDGNFKLIEDKPLDGMAFNFMSFKVDELKETSGNRDVNQGSAASGVTAAAAISALQEAGNKLSRDMLALSYDAYTEINYFAIEMIRQFYDVERTFRIIGEGEAFDYVSYSNKNIAMQQTGLQASGTPTFRMPVFDIKVKPQRSNPFSRMAQNETAKELYHMGVFVPDNADQALILLSMMDFEGKDALVEKISKNRTLLETVKQLTVQLAIVNMQLHQVTDGAMGSMPSSEQMAMIQQMNAPQAGTTPSTGRVLGSDLTAGMDGALQNATTPYGARLQERARVSVNDEGNI